MGFMSRRMNFKVLPLEAAFKTGFFSWNLADQETSDDGHHVLDRNEYDRIVEDVIRTATVRQ